MRSLTAIVVAVVVLAAGSTLGACKPGSAQEQRRVALAIGNPERGEHLIRAHHCGRCHTIPGIRGADGAVGPPLDFFSRRVYIAGELPNTPDNLVRWVMDPKSIEPRTAMPTLGLDARDARDVAAYLYTLE